MNRTITVKHNGKTYTGEIARITATTLGEEDHGIFTAWLTLEGPSWGQGMGGYALDKYSEDDHARHGTAFGLDHVMRIIETAGVRNWEDLVGKSVVALREEDLGMISGFQSLNGERTLIFAEHAKQHTAKEAAALKGNVTL